MKTLLSLLTLITCTVATAQNNQFMIYSMKGQVVVTANGQENKARIGQLLDPNASLSLANNSVVTIICNQVNLFSIDKKGKYNLANYKDSCVTNKSSFTANYLRYVWAQMSQKQEATATNRKLYMNTIGAVSRSINNIWIDPRLDTIIYADGYFPLSWKSYAEARLFDFYLYDKMNKGSLIFRDSTNELQVPLNAINHVLKPGTYYWTAAVKNEQNEEKKILKIITAQERDQLIQQFKQMVPAFESEAETAFRLGFQLEEAHYLADAYHYYQKAATLQPDQPAYLKTFMAFKKDYDIK